MGITSYQTSKKIVSALGKASRKITIAGGGLLASTALGGANALVNAPSVAPSDGDDSYHLEENAETKKMIIAAMIGLISVAGIITGSIYCCLKQGKFFARNEENSGNTSEASRNVIELHGIRTD